ncbi:MFS transporter [Candidatus Roizmanbacteria bacterium]|nr:MFS transporter [Candidatus Roizmanbacteria bacterium]
MKNKLNQLFALHFLNDGFLASIILLLPFIKQNLSLTLTQIGFLTSILSISGIVLSLPAGYFGHKFGPLKILSLALLFYAAGFIALGLSSSYFFLILSFLIAALGFGIFHPIGFSLVAKWAPANKIGSSMGDFTAIGDVGRIILSSGIPFIIVTIGWRNTSFIYAVISIFFLFIILLLHNKNTGVTQDKKIKELNFWQIIKNRKFVFALLTNFFDNLASSAIFAFLPFLLLERNINPSLLGIFTGAFLAGNFIGKTGLGRLADKFKNTTVFIVAEFFMAVFIFFLTTSNSQLVIISFSVILGILTAGTIPVRSTMISESTKHHKQYEKVFAIASVVATSATSLAPIILGRVADLYGIINSFYIAAIFALMALIPAYLFSRQKNPSPVLTMIRSSQE